MTEIVTLPDADLLLKQLLTAASVTNHGTEIPRDLTSRLPFAVAVRFGGAPNDPRFVDRATISVDTWAATRKGARDLSMTIFNALLAAKRTQTVYAAGSIAGLSVISMPSELRTPNQADNVWRFNGSYSLILRPA